MTTDCEKERDNVKERRTKRENQRQGREREREKRNIENRYLFFYLNRFKMYFYLLFFVVSII